MPECLSGHRGPHRAAEVDQDLLRDIAAAVVWWAEQETWRVSSSLTGGGVIEAFEEAVAAEVGPGMHALALPSATAALSTVLRSLRLPSGARIGVPAVDWAATRAVAQLLDLRPVPLPVTADSRLLDVGMLADRPELLSGLSAVVCVHLHGLGCDVPTLRELAPHLPVIEDAAQAWGACYPNGMPVGSQGTACVFSFGPTKVPSAGELGCLVTATVQLHHSAVALTQHPTRQLLAGVETPRPDSAMARVAPAVAVLGAFALNRHSRTVPELRARTRRVAACLHDAGLRVLSDLETSAPGVLAVMAAPEIAWRAVSRVPEVARFTHDLYGPDLRTGEACAQMDAMPALTVVSVRAPWQDGKSGLTARV